MEFLSAKPSESQGKLKSEISEKRGRPKEMKARLQVMKFGGTSVGDAACIARTAQIIAQGAREGGCVAVVSAMSGVTNRLIEAAKRAGAGETGQGAAVLATLRTQHEEALKNLVREENARRSIKEEMEEVFAEGSRLFEGTALLRELTPRTLDAISSLGERLSAPLVVGSCARARLAERSCGGDGSNYYGRIPRRRGTFDGSHTGTMRSALASDD